MPTTAPPRRRPGSILLRLIAVIKLLKALGLILAGFAAMHLVHRDVEATIINIVRETRIDEDNRYVHALLHAALRINDRTLRLIEAGTFVYATLFTIEGLGLWFGKLWAEYFTIITTSLLIPLEVYEMCHNFKIGKLVLFLLNVAIVLYLAGRVRRRMRFERDEIARSSSTIQSPANP